MASWGLDGDTLRAAGNPRLVSCSITAFGSVRARRRAARLRPPAAGDGRADERHRRGRTGAPVKVGAAVVDLVCGLLAVVGIQAALVERERTGAGRHVEVSLMDSVLTSLLNQGSAWVAGGVVPSAARQPPPEHRAVRDLRGGRPAVRGRGRQRPPVRAAVRGDRARPSSRTTSASRPTTARVAHVEELGRALEAVLPHRARRPLGRAPARGRACPSARSTTSPRRTRSPPSSGLEPIRRGHGVPLITPPLRIDGARPAIRYPPPKLDEHGDEIRRWLAG